MEPEKRFRAVHKDPRDLVDAEKHRLRQSEELLLRFKEAHGRDARNTEELNAWCDQEIAAGRMESPIQARPRQS